MSGVSYLVIVLYLTTFVPESSCFVAMTTMLSPGTHPQLPILTMLLSKMNHHYSNSYQYTRQEKDAEG